MVSGGCPIISHQPHLDEQGRAWQAYGLKYVSDGMAFTTTIWALSPEHAQCILEDIKETGEINDGISEKSL